MLSNTQLHSLISNRILELILFPTEQCNFRCTYCYEDFAIGKMQPETVNAVKKLISNRLDGLDTLKISWFGGEPLAAKDIVFDISQHILSLMPGKNVNYIGAMTTNGFTLNKTVLENLIAHGIKHYQISLDGPAPIHDKTRKRLNGEGSFLGIWRNLLAAKELQQDFSIMLRIHVTPDNYESLFILLNKIGAAFSEDQRFTVFFKAIENLGGPTGGSFDVIKHHNKATALAALYNHAAQRGIKVKQLNDGGCYVCYAAQTNAFTIRADGRVGKCTVALQDERNVIGRISSEGELQIHNKRLGLWTRDIKTQNPAELGCPMYKLPAMHSG